jgi:hypothetical protein
MTKLWVTRIRLIAPPRMDTHAPRLMSPPSWVPGALLEGAHPLKPTISIALTNLFYVIKAARGKKKLIGYRRVCHSRAGIHRAIRAVSAARRGGHLDDVDDGLEAVAEGDGEELGGVIANLGTEPNVRPTHERLDIIGPKIGNIIFLENIPEADIRCGGKVVF